MTIHREGYHSIGVAALIFGCINILSFTFLSETAPMAALAFFFITLIFFIFIVSFFRIPNRTHTINANQVISPADGKVVAIEEILDIEYFHDKRIQVSIFMSPANVHVNRNPISGVVTYQKYHPGKYLVAWHPKSSEKNERNTVVIEHEDLDVEILVRQIAGKLARKIRWYLNEGDEVLQNAELGFIKFGSRVDLFLPLGTKINVDLKQKVKGGITVIGTLSEE